MGKTNSLRPIDVNPNVFNFVSFRFVLLEMSGEGVAALVRNLIRSSVNDREKIESAGRVSLST